jgi:SAM-dependent methyltransferase
MHADCDPTQFRRPRGKEGRLLLEDMNDHHRRLSEWALTKIPDVVCNRALDIGCGGGMLISLLARRYPDSVLYGVDISEESIEMTKELNAELVMNGRCIISMDSVSDLPFEKGFFDIVTAFETYFFWPDLENDIRKAASAVARNGYMIIVSETYPHPDFKERNDEAIRLCGLNLLDNDAMASLMEECGMDVTVNTVEEKNWVAFVGRKI